MICAWADPDSLILESNESNNVACGLLDVIPSPLPNLVLSSADLVLTPLPPFANGTLVQVVTMVHNVGGSSSSPTAVRFYDGVPPSPRVGTDQPLASLPTSGTEVVSVTWEAVPPGTHDICALVDPENLVAESDETDNGACTPASVYEVRSDYVPSLPQPGSPLIVGLSVPVFLSVIIENIGNASGGESTVLAFYNETAPATPFASTLIAPLPVLGASARLVARWIPPPVLGAYRVVAAVDYERQLFEWDESNNDHTWTINVVAGPVTTLTLGTPSVSAAQTYVTSATPLSLAVLDGSGTGVRSTRYRVDGGAWAEYSSGPFTLDGETAHLLEWFSEDFAGNVEAIQSRVLVVDDTPPTTTAVIGDPQHLAGGTFVTSSTPIMLSAQDGGPSPVGLAHLEYRIDGGPWSSYSKPFPSGGEGTHTVEIRSADLLGNAEPITILTMIVDDTAPSATIDVGEPKYADPALFVTSSTPIRLPVSDGGPIPVGLASLEYRVDGDAWNSYAAPFALVGLDGTRIIDVRATDHLGNAATVRAAVVLDNTPPASTLRSASSPYTVDTAFTLGASDAGSGVLLTEYRINGSPMWIVYNWAFALPPGDHVVHLRSTDNLGNVEPERTVSVTIAGTLVAQPKTNWKPWVATIFTIVLAVLGAWSSLRNPVFLGRNSWARTFALTALPFVAAEAATGIVSALTGALAIPPGLGPGAVVDTGILIVGTLVFVLCRKTPLSQSR